MLTKLAWKEQGYLYHQSSAGDEGLAETEELGGKATTPSSALSEACDVYDDEDDDDDAYARRGSRSSGSSSVASTTSCSPSDSMYGRVASVNKLVDYGFT